MRSAGEIDGLDFVLDGCEDCDIVLADHTSQILVDYCKRCTLVLGPTASSVFLRNCEGCRVKAACGQLRVRDCSNCDFLVLVPGQPIIETSKDLRFGPLLHFYDGFEAHMEAAGLTRSLANMACRWTAIYDFSPKDPPGVVHWTCLDRREAEELSIILSVTDHDVPVNYPRDKFPGEVEGDTVTLQGKSPTAKSNDVVSRLESTDNESISVEDLSDSCTGERERPVQVPTTGQMDVLATFFQPWMPNGSSHVGSAEVCAAVDGGMPYSKLMGALDLLKPSREKRLRKVREVAKQGGADEDGEVEDLLAAVKSRVLFVKHRSRNVLERVRLRLSDERFAAAPGTHRHLWLSARGTAIVDVVAAASELQSQGFLVSSIQTSWAGVAQMSFVVCKSV